MTGTEPTNPHGTTARQDPTDAGRRAVDDLDDLRERGRQVDAEIEQARRDTTPPDTPKWVDSGTEGDELDDQTIAPPG